MIYRRHLNWKKSIWLTSLSTRLKTFRWFQVHFKISRFRRELIIHNQVMCWHKNFFWQVFFRPCYQLHLHKIYDTRFITVWTDDCFKVFINSKLSIPKCQQSNSRNQLNVISPRTQKTMICSNLNWFHFHPLTCAKYNVVAARYLSSMFLILSLTKIYF